MVLSDFSTEQPCRTPPAFACLRTSGGLSEVEVFSGKKNIARGCQVTASAEHKPGDPRSGNMLTDGITTSAEHEKGYWLLPPGNQGWAEIHLRESEKQQERLSVPDVDDNTPAANALSEGLEWLIRQQQSDGHWTFTTGPNSGSLADSPVYVNGNGSYPIAALGIRIGRVIIENLNT